jgi:hypothetical protein
MAIIIATNPPVEIASRTEFRYACSHCGKRWDGPPPTFEDDKQIVVGIITLTFCSIGCANENLRENTVVRTENLQ